MENFLFYLTAAGALAGALGVVLARNPMGSVIALLGCFFCLAAIYLLAGFQLLAGAQILVYAGAILVLFLFVIMLLNLGQTGPLPRLDRAIFVRRRWLLSTLIAVGLALASFIALARSPEAPAAAAMPESGLDAPGILARSLFGPYALPFEATSLLLLATAVAVVVLAKRDPSTRRRAAGDAEKPETGA